MARVSPTGAGFSYVKSMDLLITDNQQMADDLVAFFHGFAVARPVEAALPAHVVWGHKSGIWCVRLVDATKVVSEKYCGDSDLAGIKHVGGVRT